MPEDEFLESVDSAWWMGLDRLPCQIAQHICCQTIGGLVAPHPVLFKRPHDDPIQLISMKACQLFRLSAAIRGKCWKGLGSTQLCTLPGWFFFPHYSKHFQDSTPLQVQFRKWRRSGSQFVE